MHLAAILTRPRVLKHRDRLNNPDPPAARRRGPRFARLGLHALRARGDGIPSLRVTVAPMAPDDGNDEAREPYGDTPQPQPPRALIQLTSRSLRFLTCTRKAASVSSFPLIRRRVGRRRRPRQPGHGPLSDAPRLRLLAGGDGCSLVSLDGEPVFSATGRSGRWRCLEFAQNNGVVALVS
jgi:hypothetical protein